MRSNPVEVGREPLSEASAVEAMRASRIAEEMERFSSARDLDSGGAEGESMTDWNRVGGIMPLGLDSEEEEGEEE